ncbi:MAG: hypothetical protein ACLRSW_03590 [Christensenellaceae bacterium]
MRSSITVELALLQGPFKLDTFSATQILLTKNEYYWNANIGFERVKLYSNLNQTYS